MNRSERFRLLLLLLLLTALLAWLTPALLQRFSRSTIPLEVRPPSPVAGDEAEFEVVRSRPLPEAGVEASGELLQEARRRLGPDGRAGRCGPYRLLHDLDDPALLEACDRIGERLDDVYRSRFGVGPIGEPSATVVLFADGADYREFAKEQAMPGTGYSGYSMPTRGYVALWADRTRTTEVTRTLAHELTHLVHRRALGGNLPRWLSEGLADAIGDTADEQGIGPLEGLRGVEGQAERLRAGLRDGAVESVARLVALDDARFDAAPTSYDYEQSALLVRLLLLDPELAAGFRDFLSDGALGDDLSPERLRDRLGVDSSELDRRLRSWLTP